MLTIVTEWFDLERNKWEGIRNNRMIPSFIKRSREDYFQYFNNLCEIKNPIIIYTEPHLVDEFKEIGKKHSSNLTVIPYDFFGNFVDIRSKIIDIMNSEQFINFVQDPSLPEYWNENYVLVNFLKTILVKKSYDDGLIPDNVAAAWIDFGYVRDKDRFPVTENFLWKYADFNDDKIHLFQIKDIDTTTNIMDTLKYNIVYFQGCHAASNKYGWDKYQKIMELCLHELLVNNLVDDDQTLMLMAYLKFPSFFTTHKLNTEKDGWFVIFKEFYE